MPRAAAGSFGAGSFAFCPFESKPSVCSQGAHHHRPHHHPADYGDARDGVCIRWDAPEKSARAPAKGRARRRGGVGIDPTSVENGIFLGQKKDLVMRKLMLVVGVVILVVIGVLVY